MRFLSLITRVSVAALLLSLPVSSLTAQTKPQTREGFWINFGLGAGSLGCEECTDRSNGFSGQLSMGGTISPRLLIGGSSNGWTKTEDGATLTMGSLAAIVRFYPSATGGFFLNGGLGLATLDVDLGVFGSDNATGASAIIGIGYDARVGKNFSLTPYLNSIGGSFDGGTANFVQFGLGFSWH